MILPFFFFGQSSAFSFSTLTRSRVQPSSQCVERKPFTVSLKAISIPQAGLKLKVTQDKKEVDHRISWREKGCKQQNQKLPVLF
jgi:hypothetical protein